MALVVKPFVVFAALVCMRSVSLFVYKNMHDSKLKRLLLKEI